MVVVVVVVVVTGEFGARGARCFFSEENEVLAESLLICMRPWVGGAGGMCSSKRSWQASKMKRKCEFWHDLKVKMRIFSK